MIEVDAAGRIECWSCNQVAVVGQRLYDGRPRWSCLQHSLPPDPGWTDTFAFDLEGLRPVDAVIR